MPAAMGMFIGRKAAMRKNGIIISPVSEWTQDSLTGRSVRRLGQGVRYQGTRQGPRTSPRAPELLIRHRRVQLVFLKVPQLALGMLHLLLRGEERPARRRGAPGHAGSWRAAGAHRALLRQRFVPRVNHAEEVADAAEVGALVVEWLLCCNEAYPHVTWRAGRGARWQPRTEGKWGVFRHGCTRRRRPTRL